MSQYCFYFCSDPFDTLKWPEGIDMAYAACAFDQTVTVIIQQQHCYLLESDPEGHPQRQSLHKKLNALSVYGAEQLLICADSASDLQPAEDWEVRTDEEIQQLLRQADETWII